MERADVIGGVHYDRASGRRPSKKFKAGRVCGEEGCETKLSIYNPESLCAFHRVPRHFVSRSGKERP